MRDGSDYILDDGEAMGSVSFSGAPAREADEIRANRPVPSPTLEIHGATFECHVDPHLLPTIQRTLTGTTSGDQTIDTMLPPSHPAWLVLVVCLLRWYRGILSPHLGNRCVFEPSCSRYSELAFRKHGFLRGLFLTICRVVRCRPGSGGVDFP